MYGPVIADRPFLFSWNQRVRRDLPPRLGFMYPTEVGAQAVFEITSHNDILFIHKRQRSIKQIWWP
jgi:hypothetical protein